MPDLHPNPRTLPIKWRRLMEQLIVNNVLDSMSDSLLVLGEKGEILFANKRTEDVLGYSPEELKEKGAGALFFPEGDNDEFNEIFVDTVFNKSTQAYREVNYYHPDGSMRRLATTTSYLLAEGEHETRFIGFVALLKDITEIFTLRRLEKQLIEEKERVARAKIKSLHKLAMGVAHEIRNPLVSIGGFAGRILRDGNNPDEMRRYAQNILENAKRLELIVEEVQECCNLPEMNPSLVKVSAVVGEAISQIMPRARQRSISLRFHDATGGQDLVVFDPLLMRMALVQLLENAVDFSPDGADIDVSFYRGGDANVLEVKDCGTGIKAEDLDYIFDPFFSTRTDGPGMGLAIVQSVVQEHLGRIEVDSEPGNGTTFRIILPPRPL